MFYVYILKSLKTGDFIRDQLNNLERRLYEHNIGQTKYTSKTRPFELVYKDTYNTKIEASRRERFLKTGKGRELLRNIVGS